MTKILYIAGYGRSGSTILDLVLGNHPDICSLGEVGFLIDEIGSKDRICACGQSYNNCDFWKDFARKLNELNSTTLSTTEAGTHLSRVFSAPRRRDEYTRYCELFSNHLENHSNAKVFIDSSKTARAKRNRPLLLSKYGSTEVYILHLVRNGKSVTESLINKGSNWAMEGHHKAYNTTIIRTVVGWISANLWTMSLQLLFPKNRYFRLKFEDFQSDPEQAVSSICNWLEIDPDPLTQKIEAGGAMAVGHMVGGNRVRHSQNIRLEKTDRSAPGSELSLPHRIIFACTAGPLNRLLGFK